MAGSPEKYEGTKSRLIEAAGEVFARQGFRAATIREICRKAGSNIGAVNYHFRDKEGLYAEVLRHSHLSAIRRYPPDLGLREGATAKEKLRAFINSFLLRMLSDGVPAWHGKLMAREIANPTAAIDLLVESSIRPLHVYLKNIIRELLNEEESADRDDDELAFLCAMSVVGQCLQHFTGRRVIAALRPKDFDPADIVRITEHITRFSLGGIREVNLQHQHRSDALEVFDATGHEEL